MLDHSEKMKLVIELINSGCTDPDKIIHCIKVIEQELFKKTT